MLLRHYAKHLAKGMAYGLSVCLAIIGGFLGLFILCFGWQRFLDDFWPVDNSRVGPNLAASVFAAAFVIGFNEYRTVLRSVEQGESLRQIATEVLDEVISPIETAEEHVADKVVEGLEDPAG